MKNEERNVISVIIPVYNIEEYVRKCLESVCGQSYKNLEIIIVDDGSKDNSSTICREFAGMDKRIKYVYQENRGLVCARKTGLLHATGNFIVFVDGDDAVDENYVAYLYKQITRYDVDFVHCNYKVNGIHKKFFRERYVYSKDSLSFPARQDIILKHVFEWRRDKDIFECQVYASIYKKFLITQCFNLVPEHQSYGEDLICFIHLIMNCDSMALLPEAHYNYTIREDSLAHSTNFMLAISNKLQLYNEMMRIVKEYQLNAEIDDKLLHFFCVKVATSVSQNRYKEIDTKELYFQKNMEELNGKKIVLYGAGRVGQGLYLQLNTYENINIVLWVDKNYEKIVNKYRKLESPEKIKEIDYDAILIAVYDDDVADGIIKELIKLGIEADKIIWRPPSAGYMMCLE